MNMLQRNPRDSKHREFHDGEYEYWPVKAPVSGKKINFPAACLIAALAAAALLAAALTMLYTLTSPRAIYEDSAIVNVNIYNNVDSLDVRYTLSPKLDPDTVIQEGPLEHSEHTLNLRGLTPGTQYILQYMSLQDGEWKPIGDFQFTTPGNPPEQSEQPLTTPAEPSSGSEPASGPEPASGSKPVSGSEPTDPTEATTETEDTDEPIKPPPFWPPQKPNPTPEPTPNPTPKPPANPEEPPTDTEESTPETEETTPDTKPTALEPVISSVIYNPGYESGGLNIPPTYSVKQTHSFQNIADPDEATMTIFLDGAMIFQNGNNINNTNYISDYQAIIDENGILNVNFTETMDADKASTTTVTVTWEDDTSVSSTIDVPFANKEDASLTIDDSGIFTLKVPANNSNYKLKFEVELMVTDPDFTIEKRTLVMTGPVNGVYTGTIPSPFTNVSNAWANVSVIWEDTNYTGDEAYPQFFQVYRS